MRRLAWILGFLCAWPVWAVDLPFVNWENHPIHALDRSPNGRLLAVAHTADQRVQLFDISSGAPVAVGSVVVGIDPVSVRFRNDDELWAVNHISDSVSIIDVPGRHVRATLNTADEPFDVVFASGRAFVSCSQVNQIEVYELADLNAAPQVLAIAAEDPRALAVSADGRSVYAAIFESGNATTILGGGLQNDIVAIPNVVSDSRGPYAGVNPPPNSGDQFDPPVDPAATPPAVGLIVRKRADGRWTDDNSGDWSELVSGSLAEASGRVPGWDLPDRDIAVIDAQSLSVRYLSGLMNIGMALAVRPGSGQLSLVGTDAINEVRFEPKVNGGFVRVKLALVDPAVGGSQQLRDLNDHLNYAQPRVDQGQRDRSIGDPRAVVWQADGSRAWIAGMGSNNVVAINAAGERSGQPIEVGEGPLGLALDEPGNRLYVWNHFEASLSVVDIAAGAEIDRIEVFNPLPLAIRQGRPLLYDTHRTSGLGQAACASCHVDARMDRLAWDLGDPSKPPADFDQNCITELGSPDCEAFHSMKGPMTTQTMQDIIGHEPFHWRGDRTGLEAFNPAFEGLLGDDVELTGEEMQRFENFLATVTFPPNPYRNLDNSLPTELALPGHYTSGRFSMRGLELAPGNAQRGLDLYTRRLLDSPFNCSNCHTLPTGMATNGPLFIGTIGVAVGGSVMPPGMNGENHLGIVSVDGSTNVSIKVPHLRNQYEKVGFNLHRNDSAAGFGFLHDGSVDSISSFLSARAFSVRNDQEVADLVALMLAFSGSDFEDSTFLGGVTPPQSKDSHAAVGTQLSYSGGDLPALASQMRDLARAGEVDLIVRQGSLGYAYRATDDVFISSAGGEPLSVASLQGQASSAQPLTLTLVPAGLGVRLAVDRDGDGVGDQAELVQGSDPANPESSTLKPRPGLWFNPARSGHGFDLQFSGPNMFVLWYTYEDDGTPVWYLASAPYAAPWVADLNRFTWNPDTGFVDFVTVGQLSLSFSDARSGEFTWSIGERSGVEPVQPLTGQTAFSLPDRTGAWYREAEPGWGLSVHTDGDLRVAILYFYDADNQPRWTLGQGLNSDEEVLPMWSFTGFCPDCEFVPTSFVDAGSLQFRFDGARNATVTTNTFFAGQPMAPWQRGPVPIVPLSDEVVIGAGR
ncbi:MAG: hypothetical protein KDI71_10005 [Xanthomonadales bacterium]|nr:hypothetical protein [Xanthomonadales bacterium]